MENTINKINRKFLTLALCTGAFFAVPYAGAHADGFSAEQKKELDVLFKDYIANHPQEILDSVDAYRGEQEKQVKQSAQENLKEYTSYFASEDRPSAGNAEGDVTIVEFFDYNCGYCKKAFEDVQKIIKEDSGIRVVFQEMPILSPSSRKMAELSMAANMQGKYFELHTALMNYRGPQSEAAFMGVAEKIELDIVKLKEDAQGDEVKKNISQSVQIGRKLGIRGTPGFVIGDEIYPGYIGLDGLRRAVKEARDGKKDTPSSSNQ